MAGRDEKRTKLSDFEHESDRVRLARALDDAEEWSERFAELVLEHARELTSFKRGLRYDIGQVATEIASVREVDVDDVRPELYTMASQAGLWALRDGGFTGVSVVDHPDGFGYEFYSEFTLV